MCLAVPGRVEEIHGREPALREARVVFAGVAKSVSLALLPDASVGDHVLVHAGFAIARLDEAEARRVKTMLDQLDHSDKPDWPGADERSEARDTESTS